MNYSFIPFPNYSIGLFLLFYQFLGVLYMLGVSLHVRYITALVC